MSALALSSSSQKIEFNNNLINQMEGFITQECMRNYAFFNSSFGYDLDDIRQEILIFLNSAVELYDANRGTKFSTFAISHIKCRIINLRRMALTKKRHSDDFVIENATDAKCWALFGTEKNNQDGELERYEKTSYFSHADEIQNAQNTVIDIESRLLKLNKRQQDLFKSIFVEGRTAKEMKQSFVFSLNDSINDKISKTTSLNKLSHDISRIKKVITF